MFIYNIQIYCVWTQYGNTKDCIAAAIYSPANCDSHCGTDCAAQAQKCSMAVTLSHKTFFSWNSPTGRALIFMPINRNFNSAVNMVLLGINVDICAQSGAFLHGLLWP